MISHRKELISLIQKLSYKHSTVFQDFVAMCALTLSLVTEWTHKDERAEELFNIRKKYTPDELNIFAEMMYHLGEECERHKDAPEDVLGLAFEEFNLHNSKLGQFFTPQYVSDLLSDIAGNEVLQNCDYETVYDPAVGGGVTILSFAKSMSKQGHDFRTKMVATAVDVDIRCVHMAYVQLSLYGIPGVVIHGNSITVEEWSRWYTPTYVLDKWFWRESCGMLKKRYYEDELLKCADQPMYKILVYDMKPNEEPAPPKEFDIDLSENKHGQISLF